jgi:hypothetical protein
LNNVATYRFEDALQDLLQDAITTVPVYVGVPNDNVDKDSVLVVCESGEGRPDNVGAFLLTYSVEIVRLRKTVTRADMMAFVESVQAVLFNSDFESNLQAKMADMHILGRAQYKGCANTYERDCYRHRITAEAFVIGQ